MSKKNRFQHVSADRPVVTALGFSVVISALYFVLALGFRGEDSTTALWQSLFCLVVVGVLTLISNGIRRMNRSRSQ